MYGYSDGDPLNMWDPFGLEAECVDTPQKAQCLKGSTVVGVRSKSEPAVQYSNSRALYAGALGGGVRVSPRGIDEGECFLARLSLGISVAADAIFFLGVGSGIRWAWIGVKHGRTVAQVGKNARYARTNRAAVAGARQAEANAIARNDAARGLAGYYSIEGVNLLIAQSNLSWEDFLPFFSTAKAYEEMKAACN